jgi:hypothetical protein
MMEDGAVATMERVAQGFWDKFYPSHILPADFGRDSTYAEAQRWCRNYLTPVTENWNKLLNVIQESRDYVNQKYLPTAFTADEAGVAAYPLEGYPVRVHTDPFYRKRWLWYMNEGYLFSRPFPRAERLSQFSRSGIPIVHKVHRDLYAEDELLYDKHDIPPDPRVLEPFVMRLHYFLKPLDVPERFKTGYAS